MKKITIQELRSAQLEILDSVAKFCDEHDIKYFLAFGTLLGAVRHKGYIPWDDDIDIGMLRPDYDKFMQMFNSGNSRFYFMCPENDKTRSWPYGGIVVNKESDLGYALRIDVFVLESVPDERIAAKKFIASVSFYRMLYSAKIRPVFAKVKGSRFRNFVAHSFRVLVKLMRINFVPEIYIAEKLINASKIYSSCKTKRVLIYSSLLIERKNFENLINAEFEGRVYKIPAGYDNFLRLLYEDYMKLPPESERKFPHNSSFIVKT